MLYRNNERVDVNGVEFKREFSSELDNLRSYFKDGKGKITIKNDDLVSINKYNNLPEPRIMHTLPTIATVSSKSGGIDEWRYCKTMPKRNKFGDLEFPNKNHRYSGDSISLYEKTDFELAFFIMNFSKKFRDGGLTVYSKTAEARKEFQQSKKISKFNYILDNKLAENSELLIKICKSFGISNTESKDEYILLSELKVMVFSDKNMLNENMERVISLYESNAEDTAIMVLVQDAIDSGLVLIADDDSWYFASDPDEKGFKSPVRFICKIPVQKINNHDACIKYLKDYVSADDSLIHCFETAVNAEMRKKLGYKREDLEAMSINDLREIAKKELDFTGRATKDKFIGMILTGIH